MNNRLSITNGDSFIFYKLTLTLFFSGKYNNYIHGDTNHMMLKEFLYKLSYNLDRFCADFLLIEREKVRVRSYIDCF